MTEPRPSIDDDALFLEIYPSLRSFAAVVRPLEEETDDLLHDALVRTLSVGALSALEDPEAYVRTVILRVASNHRRRLGRKRRALERMGAGTSAEVMPAYPSSLQDLMHLTPIDRAILFLSIVEQRSFRDIAVLVDCSEEATRARSSRALRRLRNVLEEEARND